MIKEEESGPSDQVISRISRVAGTTRAALESSTSLESGQMDDTVRREDESDSRRVRASDNLDDAERAARTELIRPRRRATNDPPLRKRELDAPWPENW